MDKIKNKREQIDKKLSQEFGKGEKQLIWVLINDLINLELESDYKKCKMLFPNENEAIKYLEGKK